MRKLWSIILRAIRWGRRDCIDCAKDTINYSKTGNIYYIIRKSISKIAILLLILLSFSLKGVEIQQVHLGYYYFNNTTRIGMRKANKGTYIHNTY